ncbi:hypothetical protein Skr01_21590 [Sphaerisporangium krabiense]|nr:thiocillin family RiPP [Sphaerisporangium krabiense]GII62074.1 hypothetical protein Skr01_21590 [Sphaerisporangium krabiense]
MALDLHAVELPDGALSSERMPDGVALGTYSSMSTVGTMSCPVSSATCAMTVGCAG